jgi:predicted alpha/beta hydrolase
MEDGMYTVTSADGTPIAYDRYGEGPAVILVNGALGYRKFKTMEQIATALSEHYTVINYDRRGRGDSGPAGPASVEREVEDLAALIDAVGGLAALWATRQAARSHCARLPRGSPLRSWWSMRSHSRPIRRPNSRATTTPRALSR